MADDVEASRYEVSCSMKPFSARLRRMETISAVCNKLDQVMCEFAAARATARYAASNAYFSYEWKAEPQSISVAYSGSGEQVRFRLLLPDGFTPRAVKHQGRDLNFTSEGSVESRYLEIAVLDAQRGEFVVEAKP